MSGKQHAGSREARRDEDLGGGGGEVGGRQGLTVCRQITPPENLHVLKLTNLVISKPLVICVSDPSRWFYDSLWKVSDLFIA